MNPKYYADIKNFPTQFAKGFELGSNVKVAGEFNRVVLCGMGGSAFYVPMINDYLASDSATKLKIEVNRGYEIPKNSDSKTLFIISSYSGNTEETLSCLDQADAKGNKYIVITAGGELAKKAQIKAAPLLTIPSGIQPRLSTGYFIGGLIQVLINQGLLADKKAEILEAASLIDANLDEELSKTIALEMKGKVPVIYADDQNSSLAQICKIKFNENSKIQSFWNYFPELNHNEMVGFTNLVMQPYFLIFSSQFAHSRIAKRMEIFKKLLEEKGTPVRIIGLKGKNMLEEMLNAYYFVDHITYYLADAYGIDPEPVAMVEDFKKMLV